MEVPLQANDVVAGISPVMLSFSPIRIVKGQFVIVSTEEPVDAKRDLRFTVVIGAGHRINMSITKRKLQLTRQCGPSPVREKANLGITTMDLLLSTGARV